MIVEKSRAINKLVFKRNNYLTKDSIIVFDQKHEYSKQLLAKLNQILIDYVNEIRLEYDKLIDKKVVIKVQPLANKWGVAYPLEGLIILNEKLVHYPKVCIKYVLLHEYMHFIEANHSSRFYKLIENIMPDYKKQIAYLKNN